MSVLPMNKNMPWLSSLLNRASSQLPGPVMVDVAGTTLTEREIERLKHPLTGAVILFARNFESREQLTELCAAIHAVRDPQLLIVVDHEGGRVQRFKTDGFTHIPAMGKLGEIYDEDPVKAHQVALAAGFVLASELRACGVDFSFTPVLDLNFGQSQVIGDRAFHRDPRVISTLAQSLMSGLAKAGMAACGKHFPGHGFAEADSHVAIPEDARSRAAIEAEDMLPYRLLGNLNLPAIMPAHVIYPEVDQLPAGFSKVWIQDILRGELGYEGMVFSDDLSMEGASVVGSYKERAEAAFKAGCDMVLVCNHPEEADQLLNALPSDLRLNEKSLIRLFNLYPRFAALDWDHLQVQPAYQHARSLLSPYLS